MAQVAGREPEQHDPVVPLGDLHGIGAQQVGVPAADRAVVGSVDLSGDPLRVPPCVEDRTPLPRIGRCSRVGSGRRWRRSNAKKSSSVLAWAPSSTSSRTEETNARRGSRGISTKAARRSGTRTSRCCTTAARRHSAARSLVAQATECRAAGATRTTGGRRNGWTRPARPVTLRGRTRTARLSLLVLQLPDACIDCGRTARPPGTPTSSLVAAGSRMPCSSSAPSPDSAASSPA